MKLLALLPLCLLTACADRMTGTAQVASANAAARADASAIAASVSAVDAARQTAQAEALAERAKADPTPENQRMAEDARVAAASAQAVAKALAEQEAKAATSRDALLKAAQVERIAAEKAEADRSWLFLCRVAGLAGVVLGGLIGGAMWWISGNPKQATAGLVLIGTGGLCVAFGQVSFLLPTLVGVVAVVAILAWVFLHRKAVAPPTVPIG